MYTNNILSQFQSIGHELLLRGLITPHAGNMSIRWGRRLVITQHGCMLGQLTERDLVETGIDEDDESTALASRELEVHRAIYRDTTSQAVIHAHPTHAVALSMKRTEIVPCDVEGRFLLQSVPVLGWGMELKSGELANDIAREIKDNAAVVVYGHGSFAVGQSLKEAYQVTSTLEQSCHIIWLTEALK
jgi:L-fuculose-phosphate aldolase